MLVGLQCDNDRMSMPSFANPACDPTRPAASWWEASAEALPPLAALSGELSCEVAIVGGGYTGLSCALHLARDHGMDVCLLEAGRPGGGASGRNGGFCCLGGAGIDYQEMARRYGWEQTRLMFRAQLDAIELVRELVESEQIELQASGQGECQLAHSPSALGNLRAEQALLKDRFGHQTTLHEPDELTELGMRGPEFHGALRNPAGFGIHPLRYARGLANSAKRHGARIMADSAVLAWRSKSNGELLSTATGNVRAQKVVFATNGYTQPQLVPHFDRNLMPVFSNIIVTRPLAQAELDAQGWTSHQMAYDSRRLLHYFRLLPDRRFLFGGRGGSTYSVSAQQQRKPMLIDDFWRMFPAWREVEITHFWYGLLCLASDRMPHAGHLPGRNNAFFALAYHGNGVAMGSWMGRAVANLISGTSIELPAATRRPPPDILLPALRSLYLKAAYLGYGLKDRFS